MRVAVGILIFILLSSSAFAEVTRELPDEALKGSTISVQFSVEGSGRAVIAELMPIGASLVDWQARGIEDIDLIERGQELIWELVLQDEEAIITYSVSLPSTNTAVFDAVYAISPDEIGHVREELLLTEENTETSLPDIVPPVLESPAPPKGDWIVYLLFSLVLVGGLTYFFLFFGRSSEDVKSHLQELREKMQEIMFKKK